MTTQPTAPATDAAAETRFVRAMNAARVGIAQRRAEIRQAAERSKRSDAELIRVAVGSRPDLGSDVANAAGALVAARNGALADWPDADVARAAQTLQELAAA